MAVDMFLVFNASAKIEGESQDKVYQAKKAIDVLAWSWGMSQSGTFHGGGGGGAGKANFQDLSFTKYVDKGSPNLMLACAQGTHLDDATLVVRKAGGKAPVEYITIKMTEVMVTAVTTGGSGGEDRLTENVTLNFSEVLYTYKGQKKDGSEEAGIDFKFDIAANAQN